MIRIDLAKGILTDAQLGEAAQITGKDKKELHAVCYGAKKIVREEGKEGNKYDIVPADMERGAVNFAGAEAVAWLCEEFGGNITPVSIIDIPASVYHECTDAQWLSISHFAATVEFKNEQIKRYQAVGMPPIIVTNEMRLLLTHVNNLEKRDPANPMRWNDGTIMRTLDDIGYSIINGWSEGMQREFEERDAKIAAEMDDMEDIGGINEAGEE